MDLPALSSLPAAWPGSWSEPTPGAAESMHDTAPAGGLQASSTLSTAASPHDLMLTPAVVATLLAQALPAAVDMLQRPRRPVERGPGDSPRSGHGHDEPEQEGSDLRDDANPRAPSLPAAPGARADDARMRLYRRLEPLLAVAQPTGVRQELARGRRVLLATPATRPGRIELQLVWTDTHGLGRAARYRARGQPAAGGPWQHWPLHRDLDAAQRPRLVARAGRCGELQVRLLEQREAAAPGTGPRAWLDIVDSRRLLHDLQHQWSVQLWWHVPEPGTA